jgi:hypothetical protein
MKGIMPKLRGRLGARAFGLWVGGPAVVLMASAGANAAAIRHRGAVAAAIYQAGAAHHMELTASDVTDFKDWSRYLLKGPTMWAEAVHPPVTMAIRSAIWQSVRTDPGGADPMVNFLLWKQSLDPARFAQNHPMLAPELHKIALARSSPKLLSHVVPTTTSSGGPSTPTSRHPTHPTTTSQDNLIPPPAAPEPSMLLIAAGMTAWAVRKARGRHGKRDV